MSQIEEGGLFLLMLDYSPCWMHIYSYKCQISLSIYALLFAIIQIGICSTIYMARVLGYESEDIVSSFSLDDILDGIHLTKGQSTKYQESTNCFCC